MISGTCHCGAVKIELPRRPRSLTNCNCSICRRYGTLWAYYKASEVRVIAAPGATDEYAWGRKSQKFIRCGTCGCIINWQQVHPTQASRVGVNARNFEPSAIGPARIRLLDGASTWKYLEYESIGQHKP
jgi:hypothetical protein